MSVAERFKKELVEAVDDFFNGAELHVTLKVLSDATFENLRSVLKNTELGGDGSDDDNDTIRNICRDVWRLTETMVLLAKLFECNTYIEQFSKTETQ